MTTININDLSHKTLSQNLDELKEIRNSASKKVRKALQDADITPELKMVLVQEVHHQFRMEIITLGKMLMVAEWYEKKGR